MGIFGGFFGGGASHEQDSRIDVKEVTSKSAENGTSVKTYTHEDNSKTEFVSYENNHGTKDHVVRDVDTSGRESGHTTGHHTESGLHTNFHGSHKD